MLFAGIYVGDLGLYFLGALAHRYDRFRRFVGEQRLAAAHAWIGKNAIAALVTARLLPGSRLPIYAASGFLGMPFGTFAIVTGAASLAWTGAIFSAVLSVGVCAARFLGEFRYAAAVLVAVLVALSLVATRLFGRRLETGHG